MLKIPQPVKFLISSLIATAVDLAFFVTTDKICSSFGMDTKASIWVATIVARIFDTTVNFIINKLWCFESRKNPAKETVMFIALVVVRTLISGKAVASLAVLNLPFPPAIARFSHIILKLAVDSALFVFSFTVQKFVIFRKDKKNPEVSSENLRTDNSTSGSSAD